MVALTLISVLDIFLFLLVGAWTVGGGETMITGLVAKFFLGDELSRIPFWNLVFVPDAGYWKIYISLGMLFGAIVSAVLSKEFYMRFPRSTYALFSAPTAIRTNINIIKIKSSGPFGSIRA